MTLQTDATTWTAHLTQRQLESTLWAAWSARKFKPEDTPVMSESVVRDVDKIVKEVRYTGWSDREAGDKAVRIELRETLNKYSLRGIDGLFKRAYDYIKANY